MWERRAKKLWPKLELLRRTEIKEQLLDVEYTRKQGTETRAANKCDRTWGAVLAFERMARTQEAKRPPASTWEPYTPHKGSFSSVRTLDCKSPWKHVVSCLEEFLYLYAVYNCS